MTARILIAVTHLLGAGHLTRAAAIARACAARGHRLTLVSGGRPTPLIRLAGIDIVQLPPVRAAADDLATLRTPDGAPADEAYLARRRTLLVETLRETRPDVVVTELFPFGRRALAAEFQALIDGASALRSRPALVCSVRDILVAPSRPSKVDRTHALIASHYDAILVHADPGIVRLEDSWPVRAELRGRLVYTGYVDAEEDGAGGEASRPGEIVVSGGSSAAALPLYHAAVEAGRIRPELRVRLLIGHGIDGVDMDGIAGRAGPNMIVERARQDFRSLLRGAALLVSQAGYNTAIDVLATGVPALFVPFERGQETEQRVRAAGLAALGLGAILPEHELDGRRLADAILSAQTLPRPSRHAVDLAGAARSAEFLGALASTGQERGPRPARALP